MLFLREVERHPPLSRTVTLHNPRRVSCGIFSQFWRAKSQFIQGIGIINDVIDEESCEPQQEQQPRRRRQRRTVHHHGIHPSIHPSIRHKDNRTPTLALAIVPTVVLLTPTEADQERERSWSGAVDNEHPWSDQKDENDGTVCGLHFGFGCVVGSRQSFCVCSPHTNEPSCAILELVTSFLTTKTIPSCQEAKEAQRCSDGSIDHGRRRRPD